MRMASSGVQRCRKKLSFFLVVLGIGCGHIRVGAYRRPARLCLSASVSATRIVKQSNREKIAKSATVATERDAFCVVRATETCNYRQRIFNYTLSSEMGALPPKKKTEEQQRRRRKKRPQTPEQSKRNHAKAITAVSRWWWRWWRASGGSDIQGKANIIASRSFFRKPLII